MLCTGFQVCFFPASADGGEHGQGQGDQQLVLPGFHCFSAEAGNPHVIYHVGDRAQLYHSCLPGSFRAKSQSWDLIFHWQEWTTPREPDVEGGV